MRIGRIVVFPKHLSVRFRATTACVLGVVACLRAQAHAASVPEALGSSLRSCLASFRSTLRETEALKADAALQLCEPHMNLLLRTSATEGLEISSTQKKRLLGTAERLLRLIRDLVRQSRSFKTDDAASTPYRSRVTSFENALRVFYERLAGLETWTVNTSLRLGVSHAVDGSLEPVGGASAFLLLDHGSRVDAGFELTTSTPLREDTGTIELPPREIDAVAVSQLWLEVKRYRNFQLKLGVFPDTEGFFTPKRWPFVSLQGRAFLLRADGFDLGLSVRHDVFGTFSPQQSKPEARLFERNLSELVAVYETAASDIDWQLRTGWRLHWYTDTDEQLASLSVGRRRYIDDAPAPQGTRYRVSDRFLRVRGALAEDALSLAAKFEGWSNILASGEGARGSYYGAEAGSAFGPFELSLELAHVKVGCTSVPPVALRNTLFPGTLNRLVEAQGNYSPTPSLQLFTRFLYNVPKALGSGGQCANVTTAKLAPNLMDFESLIGFVYKFPDDARSFD